MNLHLKAAALLVALIAGGVICAWLANAIVSMLGLPEITAAAIPAVYLGYRFCLWVVKEDAK